MKFKNIAIHEKFSDSMPAWLKNYFLYNKSNANQKYMNPDYKGFRAAKARDVGRDEEIGTAIKVMNDKGLDENRVEIISQPLPSNINDPIFNDTDKMCLVHLKSDYDETLWMPHYSALHERFVLNDGKVTTLNYLNNKQYKQYAKDFAYIDLTNPDNFTGNLRQSRAQARAGAEERDRKMGKEAENNRMWAATQYDKSGYKKVPAVRKYADKLARYRLTKLPQRLMTARDKLADALKAVNNFKNDYLFGINMDQLAELNTLEQRQLQQAITDADNYLSQAFSQFKDCLQAIRRLPDPSSGIKPDRWSINYVKEKIDDVEKKIDNAIQTINAYLPKSIDWDPNDISIFTDDDWSEYM